MRPPTFTSTSTLLLTPPQPGFGDLRIVNPPAVSGSAYRTFILDGPPLEQVLMARGEATDPANVTALKKNLSITVEGQQISSIIRITLTDSDAMRAADIVNRLADAVVGWDEHRGRQSLESGVRSLERSLEQLEQRLASETAAGADTEATLQLVERQRQELAGAAGRLDEVTVAPLVDVLRYGRPATQADPKHALRNGTIAFIVTALLIYGLLLLRSLLDRHLKSASEAGDLTQLPVLSTYPGGQNVRNRSAAERDAADILRDNLIRLTGIQRGRPRVIIVTTAIGASGRRVISESLSGSFSRAGYRALMLDANLRGHAIRTLFEETQREGRHHERTPTQTFDGRPDNRTLFDVIPTLSLSDSPADLLRTKLPEMVERWKKRFDVIILDSAPVLPYPDTRGIAHLADHSLLVVSLGSSEPDAITAASAELRKLSSSPVGVVALDAAGSWVRFRHRLKRNVRAVRQLFSSLVLPRSSRKEAGSAG